MKKQTDAEKLCAGVQSFRPEVIELAESVLFMESKLEEARKTMTKEPLVIAYDNGGGQAGIRENPAFSTYEKLFTTYSKGLTTLMKIISENGSNSATVSSLEDRRARLRLAK